MKDCIIQGKWILWNFKIFQWIFYIKDLWYVCFSFFYILFRILNWIFKNRHLVIAVVSHMHKMFIFSSWCLATEDNVLLESTLNGSESPSWVIQHLHVHSVSLSHFLSLLSLCLPLSPPTTHSGLVRFPCWVLLML